MTIVLAAVLLLATAQPTPRPTPDACRVYDGCGHAVRSLDRKRLFMRMTGFPHGRPGFVVDHVQPLCGGGCDLPSNMQWQTRADAAAKDVWERALCAHRTTLTWELWRTQHCKEGTCR